MYYLIQSNIYSDPQHYKIFEILEELGLDYETIELTSEVENIEIKAERTDVFIYGSVKLARLAKANTNWTPGSFYGGNHTFEVNSKYYKNHLLNYETSIHKFADVLVWRPKETKFIKPYKGAGQIFRIGKTERDSTRIRDLAIGTD